MKKSIAVGLFALILITSLPQKAHASWWSSFIDWVRGATPQQIEQLKNEGPQDNGSFSVPSVNSGQPAPIPANNATPVDPSAPRTITGNCGFSVSYPVANSSLSFPFTAQGVIDNSQAQTTGCAWGMFEGTAGSAQLYYNYQNAGWTKLGNPSQIKVANWTSPKTTFAANIAFNNDGIGIPPGTPMKIIFTDENAKGDTSALHSVELPIVYAIRTAPSTAPTPTPISSSVPTGKITVFSPGTSLAIGQTYTLKWLDPAITNQNDTFTVRVVTDSTSKEIVSNISVAALQQTGSRCDASYVCTYSFTPSFAAMSAYISVLDSKGNFGASTPLRITGMDSIVAPKITSVSPQTVSVGSNVTITVPHAGTQGNIILQTADGSKTWTTGYATDVRGLGGFAQYNGSTMSFIFPSTIGRGVHPDGWWNEPTVAITPGTYKLYISALDASNNFIKSDAYAVQVGSGQTSTPTPSATPTSSPAPLGITGFSVSNASPNDTVNLYASGIEGNQTYYIYVVGNGWSNTVGMTPISSSVFSFKVPEEPAGPVKFYLRGFQGSKLITESKSGASFTINPYHSNDAESPLSVGCFASPANPMVGQAMNWQVVQSGGKSPYAYAWSGTDSLSGSAAVTSKLYTTGGTKSATVLVTTPQQVKEATCTTVVSNTAPAAVSSNMPFVLSAPTAGQNWLTGNSYAIKFYGGNSVDHLTIDFVNSSTGEVTNVRTDLTPMPQIESTDFFDVPATMKPGNYYVRVSKTANSQVLASSPVVTVSTPPAAVGVVVQSASASPVYKVGDSIPVFISASNFPAGTTFDIKLATRALSVGSTIVPVATLKSGISGAGNPTFNWQIPSSVSPANNYLILVCPSNTSSVDACGHSLVFTVNPNPSMSPNANPSGSPMSLAPGHSNVANVFYAIGDLLDKLTH